MDVYLTVLNSKNYNNTFSGIWILDIRLKSNISFKSIVIIPNYVSESQLLAICMDLFTAGSETTSKGLCFCFLYLVLFPKVQKKAHEEIDRVIGRNRLPTLEDRTRWFRKTKFDKNSILRLLLENLIFFIDRLYKM